MGKQDSHRAKIHKPAIEEYSAGEELAIIWKVLRWVILAGIIIAVTGFVLKTSQYAELYEELFK